MAKSYVESYAALTPDANSDYSEIFTGYTLSPGRLGTTTSPAAVNQVAEVTARLNEGMKTIELQPIGQGVFEGIPQEHFKEINQLSKLTGSEMTMHAPVIDLSGFTQQGWSETARQEAERQLKGIMAKSHDLNDRGNIPVTIHSSPGIPAAEWKVHKPGEAPKPSMVTVVFQETGQPMPIQEVERFYPGEGQKKWSPNEIVDEINEERWKKQLMGLEYYKRVADQEMAQLQNIVNPSSEYGQRLGRLVLKERSGEQLNENEAREKQSLENAKLSAMKDAWNHLIYTDNELREVYNLAVKYDPQSRTALEKRSGEYKRFAEEIDKIDKKRREGILVKEEEWQKAIEIGHKATSDIIDELHKSSPRLFVPVEDFALKHSAETIGNVALDSFSQWKDKAPTISLENVYPDWTFSRADQLKKLVEAGRESFIEKAVQKGVKREVAEDASKKLIGVTWDIAHINLLKKFGFSEKEISEETRKIAPFVKHAHITDNFGFEDSHLPTGMGTVNTKELMKDLEKFGFKGKVISEAGGQFVQQFKVSPNPYVMEAVGNPLYYQATARRYGTYFSGYGPFLPEQHFAMYGAGFSALPSELGGQIPGRQSRLTGTPID